MAKELRGAIVLYLEFGVYEGESIRHWSMLLDNPRSFLHGFDSFEGLPEGWVEDHPKGRFSTGGKVPSLSDNRVHFFKGWFNETLPQYCPPEHERLVINMDADLYSSTKYVLAFVRDWVKVGDWIYFDEFSDWQHEFRAFREFVHDTGMRFRLVAECDSLWNVAFKRIG